MTGRMSFGSVIDKDFTKIMPSTTPMSVHATVYGTERETRGFRDVGIG